MDHRFKALIALSLFGAFGIAHAGYAQAVPPAGWSAAGFNGAHAANSSTFINGSVRANASLNLGGRLATFPATMRFAANAPRFAAGAIIANPLLAVGVGVAAWLAYSAITYNPDTGLWLSPATSDYPISDGFQYARSGHEVWHATATGACEAWASIYAGTTGETRSATVSGLNCQFQYRSFGGPNWTNLTAPLQRRATSSCPSGWYVTPGGCVQTPPPKSLTPEEAIEEIIRHPMPDAVPKEIPVPLPVQTPEFPPFFVPSGDPVTNPTFDPSAPASPSNPPQVQPGTEVRSAPTPGSPWQVSTTPVNRPVTDPNAPPVRDPVPLPEGGAPSGNEPLDPDKKGLCDQYPSILACQTLEHEDDDTKLPEKAVEFDFNPIPGFQGAKTCPAFPSVGQMLGGREISWQPFCDTLAKISNLLLAFAWASAAFILLGRSD